MATTPNLGLHQWQAGDSFLRTDFNSDFSKIDAGVMARARCVSASYKGDASTNRKITLGFAPKLVILMGDTDGSPAICFVTREYRGTIKQPNFNIGPIDTGEIELGVDGFTIKRGDFFNRLNAPMGYFAVG